jgi:hypothetical protein
MRCTFSVMLAMVRFLSSGTEALPGPGAEDIVEVGVVLVEMELYVSNEKHQ